MSEQLMLALAEQDVPQGYKKTEVGVIPEDWKALSLNELAFFGGGTTPARKFHDRYFVSGTHCWVKTLDLNNSFIWNTEEKLTDTALVESSLKKHKAGAVLVAMYGGFNQIGRTGLIKVDAAINQALVAILPKVEQLSSEYLLFNLNFNVDYWKGVASSSRKDPNITSNDVKNYCLPVPPLAEQTAIATALSDVDALITELEKLITKKQAIKTATMQQLLTGRTRLPQFALRDDGTPKGYKASELGEIPEDWDTKKMGELARIQRGASPRPIDSPIWFDRTSSVGWLRISDVSKTVKYLTETTQSLSELGIANSRFVPQGNLVMSICATVGKPIITSVNLCIHDGFVVFNGLSVIQDHMYYILKKLEPEWSKQGQTGSQMNLNTELINTTLVLIPQSQAEQTAIATILSDMDTDISSLQQQLSKTRQIKQGMMQELLTGKTRLKV
jgi:type I restriction enzyme S subunit